MSEAPQSTGEQKPEAAVEVAPAERVAPKRLERIGAYVKEHPKTSMVVAVGATALFGEEVAVGALVGMAVAALLSPVSPIHFSEKWRARGREMLARGNAAIDKVAGFEMEGKWRERSQKILARGNAAIDKMAAEGRALGRVLRRQPHETAAPRPSNDTMPAQPAAPENKPS